MTEATKQGRGAAVETTVIVPTFNEGGNVRELVRQLSAAFAGQDAEVLFVDDSTDDTPEIIRQVCLEQVGTGLPVSLIHREPAARSDGLAGAVTTGIRSSSGKHVIVMDGDLQHPPALAPHMTAQLQDADMVVASRYLGEGDASGLSSSWRRAVSSTSTTLAKACFPRRVAGVCTDPMTGFFAFRREAVDLTRLRPRGFKILLEILTRHDLRVVEVPFVFGERYEGESKASWRNGLQFLYQMASLRMGRMARFAAVGALGTVVNLTVMALLVHGVFDVNYVLASVVAAELSILHNFLMQERFVFRDMRQGRWFRRFAQFLGFNNLEALVRVPILVLLVEVLGLGAVLGQALLLAVAFVGRFLFTSRVIYRPRRHTRVAGLEGVDAETDAVSRGFV
jgi:dolichol-phosphate mannosyltransferase